MIWSMLANCGAYVRGVAARGGRRPREQAQAAALRRRVPADERSARARGAASASLADLRGAARRVSSAPSAPPACSRSSRAAAGRAASRRCAPTPALVQFAETQLAGAIGSASARAAVASRREGGGARPRRGDEHPRRDLPGDRVLARARGKAPRARGRDRGAAGGERAAAGARPDEGRLRVHGEPRAAHAAHLDPGVRGDPARQPGHARREAPAVRRHHPEGDRAAHPADQPDPRSRQDRVRPRGMGRGAGRSRVAVRDAPVDRRQRSSASATCGSSWHCPTRVPLVDRRPRPAACRSC